MAKVKTSKTELVTVEFRQAKGDPDYGSCMWATFYLDLDAYNLMIMSDCGNYSYGWLPTRGSESFLHLLARINGDYLLGKISRRTIVNAEETWKALKEYVENLTEDTDCNSGLPDMEELKNICKSSNNARDIVDGIKEILEDSALAGDYNYCDIWQCIEMDYPAGAKKIVEIFEKNIRPLCRDMDTLNAKKRIKSCENCCHNELCQFFTRGFAIKCVNSESCPFYKKSEVII